jgi:hypothetical protein
MVNYKKIKKITDLHSESVIENANGVYIGPTI